jgi:hypothetical protein
MRLLDRVARCQSPLLVALDHNPMVPVDHIEVRASLDAIAATSCGANPHAFPGERRRI